MHECGVQPATSSSSKWSHTFEAGHNYELDKSAESNLCKMRDDLAYREEATFKKARKERVTSSNLDLPLGH